MGCHSRSIRLIREEEYDGKEKLRPLSPVSLRTKLPTDKVVNQAPTLRMIKKRNEEKVRDSPFISHKTLRDRETWLLGIGSVQKASEASLNMEIDLKNQLSKIISPIKVNQNARGLHKPKVRKMPQHLQDEHYEEEYLKEIEGMRLGDSPHEDMTMMIGMLTTTARDDIGSGGGLPPKQQQHRGMNESPTSLDQRTTGKSDKSMSSQAAVVGFSIDKKHQSAVVTNLDHHNNDTKNRMGSNSSLNKHQHQISVSANVPHGASNPLARQFNEMLDDSGGDRHNTDEDDLWHHHHQDRREEAQYRLHSPNSPFGVPHSLVGINGAATPISDLSDRDVFSAGSHLTGLYGDFEDDLVSAGSNNEDEYIRLETEEKP